MSKNFRFDLRVTKITGTTLKGQELFLHREKSETLVSWISFQLEFLSRIVPISVGAALHLPLTCPLVASFA